MLCAVGPLWAAVPPGSPVTDLQAGLPSDWDSPRKPLPVRPGSTSSGGCGGNDHWGLSWETSPKSGINLKALTFTCIIISILALLFNKWMLNFAELTWLLLNLSCMSHKKKNHPQLYLILSENQISMYYMCTRVAGQNMHYKNELFNINTLQLACLCTSWKLYYEPRSPYPGYIYIICLGQYSHHIKWSNEVGYQLDTLTLDFLDCVHTKELSAYNQPWKWNQLDHYLTLASIEE